MPTKPVEERAAQLLFGVLAAALAKKSKPHRVRARVRRAYRGACTRLSNCGVAPGYCGGALHARE